MKLHLDFETFSSVNLLKYGVHKYVEAPDFEITLCAYAVDDELVRLLDLTVGGRALLWQTLYPLISDARCLKVAHNASFEMACLCAYGYPVDAKDWQCTAVQASELGLPRSLGDVCKVLKFPEDKSKQAIGRALIRYFCIPCKPTKANGGRTRNLPEHAPERWESFKAYCIRDVEAEREIDDRLSSLPVPASEWALWRLDQRINDRGSRVDMDFVKKAVALGKLRSDALEAEAMALTGLDNPNSVKQLKKWLETEMDEELETLRKDDIKALLKTTDDAMVERVLRIRQELGKTSLKKYDALLGATCVDDRLRGTLLFYGASRTGRWAGKIFQPQNLPQNHLKDLEGDRWMFKTQDLATLETLDYNVSDTLSQLIRTALIPKDGCKFIVADFSAVEARNIAWYADEAWRLEVFRGKGKIYEASAAAAFHIPIETIVHDHENYRFRALGKVLELACGYGGSAGAVETMDRDGVIPEAERKPMVQAWRKASPNIVKFWWKVGDAAMAAVENPNVFYAIGKGAGFIREKGFLFMQLPSGRRLAYPRPMIEEGRYGPQVTYEGMNQYAKKWGRIETYGPKLVENLVQATCRDLLAHGMHQVEAAGYDIVLHVHDEAVLEVPMGVQVDEIEKLLATLPDWAEGMPHKAAGFETMFYKKD